MAQVPEGEIPVTGLLIMAASMMPAYVYVVVVLLLLVVILYGFLEFHFLGDFFRGFRGDRVNLTFHPSSMIYENVVSKCRVLQGRYLATLWLSSPHFQIAFLTLYGRPPVFTYRRQFFSVSDGGTIALDWLLASDVSGGSLDNGRIISKEDITPIVIVVPGLTSDSSSAKIADEGSFRAPNGRRCNPSLKQTTERHLPCHEASCNSYETRSCRNRLQNKNINTIGTAQNEHESRRHRTSEGAAKKFHGFKGVIGIGLCTVLAFPSLLIREVQYFYGYIAKLILPTECDIIMF